MFNGVSIIIFIRNFLTEQVFFGAVLPLKQNVKKKIALLTYSCKTPDKKELEKSRVDSALLRRGITNHYVGKP